MIEQMDIHPLDGYVCFKKHFVRRSNLLVNIPNKNDPFLWVVHTSGVDHIKSGEFIIPRVNKAGRMEIKDVEYFFIAAEDIMAIIKPQEPAAQLDLPFE